MKKCKFCDAPFQWGHDGVKWLPLVPIGMDDNLDRTHQDGDGNLRALHNAICNRTPSVQVMRLPVPVPAHAVMPQASEYAQTQLESDAAPPSARGSRRKKRKSRGSEGDTCDGSFPFGAFE
jgi:hypothetical protein